MSGQFELTAEAIQRITSAADTREPIHPFALAIAAELYWTFNGKKLTGRGFKADLRKLKRALSSASDHLERLPLQVKLTIIIYASIRQLGTDNYDRLKQVESDLRWLAHTVSLALEDFERPIADSQSGIKGAIHTLVGAYERASGKRATHTTHRDGEYEGRPLSPFGKLMVAFFREVDPRLSERRISSALRRHLPGIRTT